MQNKIVEKLRDYFGKRDEISMAFLFGSWAKGQEGIESEEISLAMNTWTSDGIP